MKRILSVLLAIVMSISIVGISDINNTNAASSNKEIYDIGGLNDYDIYLGGSRTIDVVYFDENMELIKNPDLSNYSILWEKFNKNTNNWEYYSNNRQLEIVNAKKEDFTEYRITLTNKKENGYSPYPYYLTIKDVPRSDYKEEETTTEEQTTEYKSELKDFSKNCNIKGIKKNYGYTKNEIKPSIKVYSEDLKGDYFSVKLDPKYYTLTYKNNVKPGKASITITGKAPYYGSKTITFNIKPNNAKLSKVKVKNKKIKITCKKVKCDGYEFRYKKSTLKWGKSASKSGWKTKTQKSNKFTSKKLKKGNYFVQVRSYVKVGNKKVYSNYTSRDLMTVVGKSTKIEKSRYYEKLSFGNGKIKCYTTKFISNKLKKGYRRSYVRGAESIRKAMSPYMTKFIEWGLYSKDGNKLLYRCLADTKGNLIEEKYYK